MYSNSNYNLVKFASILSIITAVIILGIKSYGWVNTQSQSIFASLIDSLLDISSSIINFIAIRLANKPPDYNHRFGHEKFEDLAVFSQSVFFFFSGIFVTFSCFYSLYHKIEITNSNEGIGAMTLCLILTLSLSLFQNYVVKKTSSHIIAVDRMHYFADFLTNVAVIFSIIFSKKIWYIDPLMGIIVAIFIIYNSYGLFKRAIKNLVDEEFDEESKQKIIDIVSEFEEVKGIHDIKTRYAAQKPFIQFHIEMDRNMHIIDAHKISNNITTELQKVFPQAEVIIYHDPYGTKHNISYPEESFRD